jgi:hypothetical protein
VHDHGSVKFRQNDMRQTVIRIVSPNLHVEHTLDGSLWWLACRMGVFIRVSAHTIAEQPLHSQPRLRLSTRPTSYFSNLQPCSCTLVTCASFCVIVTMVLPHCQYPFVVRIAHSIALHVRFPAEHLLITSRSEISDSLPEFDNTSHAVRPFYEAYTTR